MKSLTTCIFHCLRCGNVLHRAVDCTRLECCGQEMVRVPGTTKLEIDQSGSEDESDNAQKQATPAPRKPR